MGLVIQLVGVFSPVNRGGGGRGQEVCVYCDYIYQDESAVVECNFYGVGVENTRGYRKWVAYVCQNRVRFIDGPSDELADYKMLRNLAVHGLKLSATLCTQRSHPPFPFLHICQILISTAIVLVSSASPRAVLTLLCCSL